MKRGATMKLTSAYAHKMIKSLEEEKSYWCEKEQTSSTYTAAINETPVIPEYDYSMVFSKIVEIDQKILKIKHAVNVSNANAHIEVNGDHYSVDEILIEMAQLNQRKQVLDVMRKQLPQSRVIPAYNGRSTVPEYQYINYDLEVVQKDFDMISNRIMKLQMALDYYNQTFTFDVDLSSIPNNPIL